MNTCIRDGVPPATITRRLRGERCTRRAAGEIDNVLTLNDSNDEERARRKERIITERVEVFRIFYERTMIGGHAPATDEPTRKFTVMRPRD